MQSALHTWFHVQRRCVYASQHAVVLWPIHSSSPSLWRQSQLTAHSLLTWHNVATMVLVTAGHVWSQTWSWPTACWNCSIQHERANCCEAGTARRCKSESQFTFYGQHCNCNHMKGAVHVIAWCAGWQRTLWFKYEGFVSEFSLSVHRPCGSLYVCLCHVLVGCLFFCLVASDGAVPVTDHQHWGLGDHFSGW